MFETEIVTVDPQAFDPKALAKAATILRRGGLVAFPTETVYGLGAVIYNRASVENIFTVKGRPGDNPLIVHIYKQEQLAEIALAVPEQALILAQRFWPGPLTMILPKKERIPAEVSAGLPTVAIRLPSHPVAQELLRQTDQPVAAPSANLSGRPSPTRGSHVITDLSGKIEMIIDGGPTGVGVESTVLDLTSTRPRILRPGGVTHEMLEAVLGAGAVDAPSQINISRPLAPGMKYRHYAPEAPLRLLTGEVEPVRRFLRETVLRQQQAGKRMGIIAYDEDQVAFPSTAEVSFFSLGQRTNPAEGAERLFHVLRLCDQVGVDEILAVAPPRQEVGEAVYNRLFKAAGGKVEEIT
ncbi:MAG TPA: threonylcarbamoyl-AMP synthase [Firmicutes bacterium]|nr:threonylcarbamoyl-AMP synthase [Bacillota bacterium]